MDKRGARDHDWCHSHAQLQSEAIVASSNHALEEMHLSLLSHLDYLSTDRRAGTALQSSRVEAIAPYTDNSFNTKGTGIPPDAGIR
jgi:hypothetical protein